MRPITLAVNLSARQFRQQDLLGHIAQVLKETGFGASQLEIELTESILIDAEAFSRWFAARESSLQPVAA